MFCKPCIDVLKSYLGLKYVHLNDSTYCFDTIRVASVEFSGSKRNCDSKQFPLILKLNFNPYLEIYYFDLVRRGLSSNHVFLHFPPGCESGDWNLIYRNRV